MCFAALYIDCTRFCPEMFDVLVVMLLGHTNSTVDGRRKGIRL